MGKNFFGITDTGRIRDNNEDTFIAETVLDGQYIAACVIDGVGGYSGGEVAAALAHDAILVHLKKPATNIVATLKEALAAANTSIYQAKQQSKGNEQMACVLTLALADVGNNKFYYAHVGDTRLYLYRDNSLVKVTRDHSFVGFLEDSGRLTEEAAMRHPKRNEINKALGFDAQMNNQADYIETGESPFLPGDMLLLCSDGLTDMIGNSTITSILKTDKNLQAKGKALVQAANDAGGKDNITIVLVHNNKTPLKHEATKPTAVVKKNNDVKVAEEVTETKKNMADKIAEAPVRKRSGAVSVLSVLCILLLAAFLWVVYKGWIHNKDSVREETVAVVKKTRTQQEQKFIDSLNDPARAEVFILNVAGSGPITITDSIQVNKDTLHIIGNGATLIADTSYTGPALSVSQNCKYLLLDSLTIENFNVGILLGSSVLHLKNVQFKNCVVPVQYQLLFPNNTTVNGRFADTLFYNSDTVTQINH